MFEFILINFCLNFIKLPSSSFWMSLPLDGNIYKSIGVGYNVDQDTNMAVVLDQVGLL